MKKVIKDFKKYSEVEFFSFILLNLVIKKRYTTLMLFPR